MLELFMIIAAIFLVPRLFLVLSFPFIWLTDVLSGNWKSRVKFKDIWDRI